MRTGLKIPGQITGEVLQIVERGRIGGKEERLAGSSRKAGIAAYAEAKLVGIGEAVSEIAGKCAVEIGVVHALAVGVEVRGGRGVIEIVNEPIDLSATNAATPSASGLSVGGVRISTSCRSPS